MFSRVLVGLLALGTAVVTTLGAAAPAGATEDYVSRVMGHRGGPASSGLPGNTMAALDWLADTGHPLEGDLRMTLDRQFVLFHFGKVGDRCTGAADNRIDRMTLAQVQQMRCWDGAYRLSSLGEVLTFLQGRPGVSMYLESKHIFRQPHRAAARQNRLLARQVRNAGLGGRIVFQDFRADVLPVFTSVLPRARTAYLDARPSVTDVSRAQRLGASVYSYDIRYLSSAINEAAHSSGLQANIWTVASVTGAQRAFGAGADTISTDDPVGITEGLNTQPEPTPKPTG